MHTRTEFLCSCKNTALEHELVLRTATKRLGGEQTLQLPNCSNNPLRCVQQNAVNTKFFHFPLLEAIAFLLSLYWHYYTTYFCILHCGQNLLHLTSTLKVFFRSFLFEVCFILDVKKLFKILNSLIKKFNRH